MLTKTFTILSVALFLSLTSTTLAANTKEQAEELPKNCQYLKVSTNQTHIRKPIDSIIGGRNFDTDFAVPAGMKFTSFKAVMSPEKDATYKVTINLKYTDNSVSTAFRKDAPMQRGKTYSLPFQSPMGNQPYQINMNIEENIIFAHLDPVGFSPVLNILVLPQQKNPIPPLASHSDATSDEQILSHISIAPHQDGLLWLILNQEQNRLRL